MSVRHQYEPLVAMIAVVPDHADSVCNAPSRHFLFNYILNILTETSDFIDFFYQVI